MFFFIRRKGAYLLLAICSKRVLFYAAPLRYLRKHDICGERHLTIETCCKVWTHQTHCCSTQGTYQGVCLVHARA